MTERDAYAEDQRRRVEQAARQSDAWAVPGVTSEPPVRPTIWQMLMGILRRMRPRR